MSTDDHLGQQTSATVVAQSNREEAIVRAGSEPVHDADRPEDWGWHGETGRKGRIGVFFAALVLFSMQFTNHEGNVENIWLNVIAVGLLVILVWDWRRRKNAWRSK
ncbi:Protein of unknown function [Klenkia soli]|uniref:DUF2631 domain-containing protein n=1 Tax=Klenkia soli TaxID=1052260 RepID=A0A1H0I5Q7_9ACTN|nr:DUF2631 domain-containing protein [Klenkia soli]SDO26520.1 Protein of unknown function [Klenkia soli]